MPRTETTELANDMPATTRPRPSAHSGSRHLVHNPPAVKRSGRHRVRSVSGVAARYRSHTAQTRLVWRDDL